MSKRTNARKEQFLKERTEYGNIIKQSENYIRFNYKYFTFGDGFGQTFEEWQTEGILADLNNKLKDFSGMDKAELILKSVLEIFSAYPTDSEFDEPEDLKDYDIKWARLRLTGKRRLIGFFFNDVKFANVFYIVFLDEKHRFSPSHKKHT